MRVSALSSPPVLGALCALLVGCGRTDPAPVPLAAPPPAAAEQAETSADDLHRRLDAMLSRPAAAVSDGIFDGRYQLLALSDDPLVCDRLRRGAGKMGSSTVFVLMGGGDGTHYAAQEDLQAVLQAGMQEPIAGNGRAIVTAQLLDDACHFLAAPDKDVVAPIAGAGSIAAQGSAEAASWDMHLDRGADGPALSGAFVAAPCEDLLAAIMERMNPDQPSAPALLCEAF